MTPYEREYTFTTVGANEIVALPFPGRCAIYRFAIVRPATGAITADFYSRAFTSAATPVRRMVENEDGKLQLIMMDPLLVRPGDTITIAGGTAYDGSHVIAATSPDAHTIDTLTAHSADAVGGTAALAIPSAHQPLYRVTPQVTGTTFAESFALRPYVNMDPVPRTRLAGQNLGIERLIYCKLADAAAYRVLINAGVGGVGLV